MALIIPTQTTPGQPPTWCGPIDEEATATGPSLYFGRLGVLTGWTAEEGPVMWLDTGNGLHCIDLTPDTARALAATLTRFAGLIDSAAAPVLVPA